MPVVPIESSSPCYPRRITRASPWPRFLPAAIPSACCAISRRNGRLTSPARSNLEISSGRALAVGCAAALAWSRAEETHESANAHGDEQEHSQDEASNWRKNHEPNNRLHDPTATLKWRITFKTRPFVVELGRIVLGRDCPLLREDYPRVGQLLFGNHDIDAACGNQQHRPASHALVIQMGRDTLRLQSNPLCFRFGFHFECVRDHPVRLSFARQVMACFGLKRQGQVVLGA